jgi:hypothetical protein
MKHCRILSAHGDETMEAMTTAVAIDPYAIGQNLGGLGDVNAMTDAEDSINGESGDVFGAVPTGTAMIRG